MSKKSPAKSPKPPAPKAPAAPAVPSIPTGSVERERLLDHANRHPATQMTFHHGGAAWRAHRDVESAESILAGRKLLLRAEEDKAIALFLAVTTGPLAERLAAQPWDPGILAAFPGAHPPATDAEIKAALLRRVGGWHVAVGNFFLHGSRGDVLFLSPSAEADPKFAVLTTDRVVAEFRRVLKIPHPAEKKPVDKKAAKAAVAAPTSGKRPKPPADRKAAKKGELDKLAKAEAKPAKGKTIKSLTVSVLGPERFKINYRQGDSGRSIELTAADAADAASVAAGRLGVELAKITIAYRDCSPSSTGVDPAPAEVPQANPAPAEAEVDPVLSDGWHLIARHDKWKLEEWRGLKRVELLPCGDVDSKPVRTAIEHAARYYGVEAGSLTVHHDGRTCPAADLAEPAPTPVDAAPPSTADDADADEPPNPFG